MSATEATAVLDRLEADEGFAAELAASVPDHSAVLARVRAEGFDATQAELADAFLDRYGGVLTPEQLDAISAGVDGAAIGILAAIGAGGTAIGIAAAVAGFGFFV